MSNRILAYVLSEDASAAHAIPQLRRDIADLESALQRADMTTVHRKRTFVLEGLGYLCNNPCIAGQTEATFDRLWAALAVARDPQIAFVTENITAALDALNIYTHRA